VTFGKVADLIRDARDALDYLPREPGKDRADELLIRALDACPTVHAPARVTCAECKHWNEGGSRRGQCRLKPPVVLYGVDVPLWPETEPGMWCGESEAKA
jgi:hypothetical protein